MVRKHFAEAKVKVAEITKNCYKIIKIIAKVAVPILAIISSVMELLGKKK